MMRSLYSGVAGLKNHQNRMDVVGNNISNVNTTGFKSSRVTFSDTLSQTLSGASSPQGNLGGTNPKQIGLGSSLSAIDTLFTDGSVQSTGVNTDLCLSGNGLFIVNDGNLRYYTRNGNFKFDSQGYYVNSDGMKVSGWMADSDGMINSTALPGEIQIQTGKSMESKVTSVSTYTKNLDASTIGYDIGGVIVKYADGTAETVSNYTPVVKNEGVISLKLSTGETVTLDNTADYSFTADGLVTDTNGKTFYTSTIESVTANSTGKVKLTLGMGNAVTSINGSASVSVSDITSGTFSIDGKYILSGKISKIVANSPSTAGVTVTFTGPDGNDWTAVVPPPDSFKYSVGDTFSAGLPITQIDADAGATVNTANGASATTTATLSVASKTDTYARKGTADEKVVTVIRRGETSYELNGKKVESATITTTEGKTLTGLLGQNYSANTKFYPSVTTTVSVYDSLGAAHTVPVLFTKIDDNLWELSLEGGSDRITITEEDGTTTSVTLTKTNLVFDQYGSYVSGSGTVDLGYTNGASDQSVALNLAAITQYSGSSTAFSSSDGNAAGILKSVSVDSNGVITGTYTNGINRQEAQIAIAQFNNASGLTKVGNSLYTESNNSGTVNIGTVAGMGCTVTPSALEMSNVDMAAELTDMIVTQRGYQSNSKIITVSDELLETLINMKR